MVFAVAPAVNPNVGSAAKRANPFLARRPALG
jgi:hypothetical protein